MDKKLYFKNLDASRFFAFVLVFLAHCFVTTDPSVKSSALFQSIYSWGKVGVLGLEYFFVLSSFLISIIILEEKDQNKNFNISNFLIRRSLRVWPLYFLIVCIGILLVSIGPIFNLQFEDLPPWPYLFFFLVNYYIIENGTNFLFFIAFLWSISIEEQFYLIWSIFMKFIHKYFAHFCFFLIGISIVFRFHYAVNDVQLYFNTLSALGNFGVGGLLALHVYKKSKISIYFSNLPKWSIIIVYCIFFLSVLFFHQLMKNEIIHILERIIFSLFFAFIIHDQALGKNSWFQMGHLKIFDRLGKISYGLYCFHGVVITLFMQVLEHILPHQNLFEVFFIFPFVIFVFTFGLSKLSYRYFESYFLSLKNKFYTFQP